MLALRDMSKKLPGAAEAGEDQAWVQDYALLLFDADGRVAGWYSGAERIYGYQSREIVGQPVSCLCPDEDAQGVKLGGGVEKDGCSRALRERRLARKEKRVAILDERADDGTPRRRWETAGLCESGARLQQASPGGREVAARRRAPAPE